MIAHDPSDLEYCGTPGVYRGGDGGAELCGGAATPVWPIWRMLGTPYRYVVEPREIINPFTKRPAVIDGRLSADVRRVFAL